jgi:probable lipoprotein NlpC
MAYEKFSKTIRRLWVLGFLFFTTTIFAAVPIQENALRGVGAAEARRNLIAAAESLLGTPYRFGGIDRRGLDCSGLVHLSFWEGLNISIPRTAESIYSWAAGIETAELQPGDLVFFVTAGTRVSHVGIYTGGGRFIHSASEGPSTGVIYSRLDEAYWRRTFRGAGRALPLNEENVSSNSIRDPVWADPGFFVGFAAAWVWGGIFEGIPSPFRGFSTLATAGHKWSSFRTGLELRSEWDSALGVLILPLILSVGTDTFQIFGGPALVLGEPSLSLENRERDYSGGGNWLWEAGISVAFSPFIIWRGALSFYGELAWQSHQLAAGENAEFRHDIAANFRISTGIRYLWCLRQKYFY